MDLTNIGKIAREFWQQIPQHYSWVEIDEFVVMPNHIHGILLFKKENPNANKPNTFGKQSGNLAAIIRGYKASVKRYANLNNIDFWWQNGYHDHIIRNEAALQKIREYIRNNPANWQKDELF
jgi:REP element-mobilizing transposase RayT